MKMNNNRKNTNKTPRARTVAKKTAVAVDCAKNAQSSTAPTVVYATHEQTPVVYTNTRGFNAQEALRKIRELNDKIDAQQDYIAHLRDFRVDDGRKIAELEAKNRKMQEDLATATKDYDERANEAFLLSRRNDELEDKLVDVKFSRDCWAIGAIVISGVSIAFAALHFFANHYC